MPTPLNHGINGYNSYGAWLRAKFAGKRVFKVIVDAGFTCPNRDGSKGHGGCTYCNVDSFTPTLPRSLTEIRDQVEQGITRAREGFTLIEGQSGLLHQAIEHQSERASGLERLLGDG